MATETRWEGAVLDKLTSNGERVAVIEKDVSELKSDTKQLKEDVSELKKDVSILKEDVSELKKDVSILKEDVSELKTTVNTLVEDVNDIKSILGWLKWIGGAVITIALALVANAISTYVLHF